MIVRQYAPCSLGRSIICLGKQGEINALRVEFDVSAWMAMYPDATVKLMHFAPDRPQDNPVIPTLGVEGTLRVWIVGEEDTAGAGNGVIELLLIDERTGSTIKSATGYTTVLRSPSAGIEAQEPEPGYVRYDVDQSALLTDTQKAFARTNIDAIKDEKDPTVPDWAKQPRKPTYTASEVGALPSSYTPPVTSVNGKTGEVALNAQDVGARPDTWTPSASDVGADASGTAAAQVGAHNISGEAHADLRALIEGLTSRLNALADSDDNTLDQLSEIVAYIKSNRTLIDAVTTGKVSVSDIVDNLTTNASGKVLSAAQGVALKAMIDGIVIPTALPNPQPITINGQHYDGSDAVTVTTAEIDDTLTQSGKAADAKAVGDQLSTLNEATAEEVGQLKSDLDNIIEQTRNLFNPKNIVSLGIGTSQNVFYTSVGKGCYIKCKPNTKYTISKVVTNNLFYVAYSTEVPANTIPRYNFISFTGKGSATYTTGDNANYLYLYYWNTSTDATEEDVRNSIQIEEGETKTAYIPPKSAVDEIAREKIEKIEGSTSYVNVCDFGVIGDGETKVSAKLQKVIDEYSGVKTIFIPAGYYICNSPITIYKNTVIEGSGRGSVLYFPYSGGIISETSNNGNDIEQNWEIRNLYIKGKDYNGFGIEINQGNLDRNIFYGTNITNCIISDFSDGLRINNNVQMFKADGLTIIRAKRGIYDRGVDGYFNRLYVTSCNIGVYMTGSCNTKYNLCKIYYNGDYIGENTTLGCNMQLIGSRDSILTNVELQDSAHYNIIMENCKNLILNGVSILDSGGVINSENKRYGNGVAIKMSDSSNIRGTISVGDHWPDKPTRTIFEINEKNTNVKFMYTENGLYTGVTAYGETLVGIDII